MIELPTIFQCPPLARRSRALLVMALLFVAFRALPSVTYPIGRDQATYCVLGQGLLHGGQLYRDLWDMKPPGIFWIYALVVKLLGPVMWSVGVVDILWLLAISYFIFRFAERYVGAGAAVVAVVVNASWHCRAGYVHAAQPETFLVLLVFAAYFVVRKEGEGAPWRQWVAGFLLGAAFWLKYNALAFLPFLLIVPWLDGSGLAAVPVRLRLSIGWRAWLGRSAVLWGGFSTALGAVLLYFWRAGLWRTLWESHFEVVSRYAASELTPDYWILPFAGAIYGLGFWTVAATPVALSIAWKERELSAFGPIFLGAAMGYASVLMQVRLSSYEFEACYPFFAMVWGYLAVKSFASCRALASGLAGRGWRWGRVLLWIFVATAAFWLMRSEALSCVQRYRELARWLRNKELSYANYPAQFPLEHLGGQMQVIHYLKEESAPGDQVFVWGAHSLIYYLSGLHSPVRFVTNFPLIATWGPPAWREELMRELARSHPAFIVVARRDQIPSVTFTNLDSEEYLKVFPELNGFISRSYQPVMQSRDFVIYHSKIPPRKGE